MAPRPKKNHSGKKSGHKAHKNLTKGSFRVISGHLGSRRFEFVAVEGLRPTTDRVKETVFNWLQSDIEGAYVLDLFAGSGSLGFEAASRGAECVLMCEKNKEAARALQQNLAIAKLSEDQARVYVGDSIQALSDGTLQLCEHPFDVVLIDPPFRQGLLEEVINALEENALLAKHARVYIEQEKELGTLPVPPGWQLLKKKDAGQVVFQLFQVA